MAEIIAVSEQRYLARVESGVVRVIDIATKTVGPRQMEIDVLAHGNWTPSPNLPEILTLSHDFKWQKIPAQADG